MIVDSVLAIRKGLTSSSGGEAADEAAKADAGTPAVAAT